MPARTHALTACVADLAAVSATRDTVVKVLDSSCVRSSTPAGPAGLARGAGAEPKPTYLPPWLGGRWSGLEAFSCKGAGGRLLRTAVHLSALQALGRGSKGQSVTR